MSARMRLGVLASHPVQYQAPLFRALAVALDVEVMFAHRQNAEGQGAAGYGVAFEWDVDLLDGYPSRFLHNAARRPGVDRFLGCNTPEVAHAIGVGGYDAFLVMGWHLLSYVQAVLACRRRSVPVMVRGDSTLARARPWPVRLVKRLAYPLALRAFDRCLAVGSASRDYLVHYGVPERRIVSSPHCVDDARFARGAADETAVRAARAALGCDPATFLVLFVGRLVEFKRPGDLLDALHALGAGGLDVCAAFAGDGPLRGVLEAKARAAGVDARFLGFRNQSALPALYGCADVLALPSTGAETWGLVVNEALACGTPAVVSEAVGCARDLVVPGLTGETFPPGDVRALAEALAAVAARRGDRAVRAAIARVAARHSVETAAAGIVDAVRDLRDVAPGFAP